MCRVTFDSNVWRKVASPSKFPKDPHLDLYRKLNDSCRTGTIQGFLSETTFTLEQIKRKERLAWLKSSTQLSTLKSTIISPNMVKIQIGIKSKKTFVPQCIQMVKNHLNDAYAIGFRVFRSKRILGPHSELLKDTKYFLNYSSETEFHRYNNKNGEIARILESMGVGIANIKYKGQEISLGKGSGHWIDGIAMLPDSEKDKVAELVAEWADTDAIATSIAHDVEYFCTNDVGKRSSNKGVVSAMSSVKSQVISSKFGIQFVTPEELVQKLGL